MPTRHFIPIHHNVLTIGKMSCLTSVIGAVPYLFIMTPIKDVIGVIRILWFLRTRSLIVWLDANNHAKMFRLKAIQFWPGTVLKCWNNSLLIVDGTDFRDWLLPGGIKQLADWQPTCFDAMKCVLMYLLCKLYCHYLLKNTTILKSSVLNESITPILVYWFNWREYNYRVSIMICKKIIDKLERTYAHAGLILGLNLANERRRCKATPSLIG